MTWPTSPSSAKTTDSFSTHSPLLFLPAPIRHPYLQLQWPLTATTDLTTFPASFNCNHYAPSCEYINMCFIVIIYSGSILLCICSKFVFIVPCIHLFTSAAGSTELTIGIISAWLKNAPCDSAVFMIACSALVELSNLCLRARALLPPVSTQSLSGFDSNSFEGSSIILSSSSSLFSQLVGRLRRVSRVSGLTPECIEHSSVQADNLDGLPARSLATGLMRSG